jgi:hypothetical protein
MFPRLIAASVVLAALTGCCCCGTPTPVTDASVRVLAGPDPVVIKVDGAQVASLSADTADTFRVSPGSHAVAIEAAGRTYATKLDVKAGDDVFIGGHDTQCFAIVENPANISAREPRWKPGKDPAPATWALDKVLQPGEVWPEGRDLGHVSSYVSTLSVEMSERLAAPIPCDAPDVNAAVAIGMTAVVDKVSKF